MRDWGMGPVEETGGFKIVSVSMRCIGVPQAVGSVARGKVGTDRAEENDKFEGKQGAAACRVEDAGEFKTENETGAIGCSSLEASIDVGSQCGPQLHDFALPPFALPFPFPFAGVEELEVSGRILVAVGMLVHSFGWKAP